MTTPNTTKAERTQGPWVVETRPDVKYPDIILAQVIAPSGYTTDNGEVWRCAITGWLDSVTDAHLIAAAPELLEACKAITTQSQFNLFSVSHRRAVIAAIARAEGRSL